MLLTAPTLAPRPPAVEDAVLARTPRERAEVASFLLLAAGAAWTSRRGAGLDASWSVTVGMASTLPLLVVCRAWRLPAAWLALALALPLSVLLTALVVPEGTGAARAVAYGYGSVAFVAVAAFARTPARRLLATGALALVVLDQLAQSWLAWWGSQDPTRMLTGSFNWHNQYGIFCGAGLVVCAGVAVLSMTGRVRAAAVAVGSVLLTGLLGSASRGSVLLVAVALGLLLVIALRAVGPARAVVRLTGFVVAGLAVGLLLRSPLFFATWSMPWAPLVSRSVLDPAAPSGAFQPATGNASARFSMWDAAWRLFLDRPLTGWGLETYGERSDRYMPPGITRSVDPHNELLRAAAEGGLIQVLPLLAVLLVAAAVGLVHLWRVLRVPARASADAGRVAALLACTVLIAHSLMDFDWSYPTLVMAAGWCLAVLVSPVREPAAG
ncbi:MAG TPA: O-antigen ligase family protein [Actinomycetales bacterium]|jgi:O-antigen ligase